MARSVIGTSPVDATTKVLMDVESGKHAFDYPYNREFGDFARTTVRTGSCTASQTLLALQGPGILQYLEIGCAGGASMAARRVRVIADNEVCYSTSYCSTTGFAIVGIAGNGAPARLDIDRIVFKEKLLVFFETSTVTCSLDVIHNWRLVSG